MDKTYASPEEAIADIPNGATIAFGSFFTAGKPTALTKALAKKGVKDLTVVVQQVGTGNEEMLELVTNGQIKKAICNYPFPRSASKGAQHPFEQAVRGGKIKLEIYPIGTFVEKLRCAGAGIPGFYTPTGVGTVVAEGKEVRVFNGAECLLELALPVDFAFVHAWKGDREGNLVYRFTAQNYNNAMAMAGKVTIAEVETLVEAGELDPNFIHTPGIFVKRVVETGRPEFNSASV
ncbi:MAG: 3-oxoacid CoA-transferase subunit A [Dehalococcoidia bacterium]|nr:3-oxoacid CoA-transferase subunit A [Dehalococcoidia bacterium]MDD5648159.1 3-oxoacid CoA-transferase subunit A [Dehalococcoidia bacterium]